jgi:hypothetical protein
MLQINFGAVALVTCLGFVVQIVGSHYLNGSVRYNEALVFLMQWGSSLLETLVMAVLFRGMRVHSIVIGGGVVGGHSLLVGTVMGGWRVYKW